MKIKRHNNRLQQTVLCAAYRYCQTLARNP
jgi:hypothetical protein